MPRPFRVIAPTRQSSPDTPQATNPSRDQQEMITAPVATNRAQLHA